MKLKDLLAEGRFDMEHPNPQDEDEACPYGCDQFADDDSKCSACLSKNDEDEGPGDESCPGCGRTPGDGYGSDCNDPAGCGYWKEWAREAAAEWKRDNRRDGGMDEGANFFDKYMTETLWLEDRRAKQLKAPVVAESYGKIRQKRVQELPWNRIRIGGK